MNLTALFVSCMILTGCATQAQQQHQQLVTQLHVAGNTANTCLQPLKATPVFQRLSERFIIDTNDPRSVEKLALRDYVTEQEGKDIVEYFALVNPCRKVMIEEFGKVHPEYVVTLAGLFAEDDADAAKTINKELSLGKANQGIVGRRNRLVSEFTQIGQRIEAALNQAHQYEIAQRQLAAQALQNWGYQQQILYNQFNPATRPTYTTCYYVGQFLQCSTQ